MAEVLGSLERSLFEMENNHKNQHHNYFGETMEQRASPTADIASTESPVPRKPQVFDLHRILRQVGKTIFRPGGTPATTTLHGWSLLRSHHQALEYSAGPGTSGAALAHAKLCHVTVLTKNQEEQQCVQQMLHAKHKHHHLLDTTLLLQDQKLDQALQANDHQTYYHTAVLEATLTHRPHLVKHQILKDLHNNGVQEILLHSVVLRNHFSDDQSQAVVDDVSRAVGSSGFYPMTVLGWNKLLQEAGYHVTNVHTGPLVVSMSPKTLIQEEGLAGCLHMVWNLTSHPEWRAIVGNAKETMARHHDSLGYIILRAEMRAVEKKEEVQ